MQGAHVTLGKGPADRIGGREGWLDGRKGREGVLFCLVRKKVLFALNCNVADGMFLFFLSFFLPFFPPLASS